MNETDPRIAVAQLHGYKREMYIDTYEGGSGRIRWKRPDGGWAGSAHDPADLCHLPEYLYDLNACHLVEEAKLTTPELQEVYCGWLDFITFHSGKPVHKGRHGRYSATAAQRVEALLRTFNLYIP